MRVGTLGREAGWVGLQLQSYSRRAVLPEQQWLPEAQIIPVLACGITRHVPGRRRSSLGGLMQNQRKLHPLLGVLLRRALHSLQNGKRLSKTRGNGKLCLSVCVKQLSVEVYVKAAVKKGTVLPIKRKGIPDVPPSTWKESRCHVVWLSQNLRAVDKLLLRSRNSRLSGWLSKPNPVPLCSYRILH